MGHRAKKSSSTTSITIVLILLAIAVAPKGGWTFFLMFLLISVVVSAFREKKAMPISSGMPISHAKAERREAPSQSTDRTNSARTVPAADEFLTVTLSIDSPSQSYSISRPSLETAADVRWVPAGETVQVAGTTISGGLFYVGTPRRSDAYSLDGCVLNAKANISETASDLSKGPENYWLSYDAFSSKERRAYIQWLASDRSAPDLHHSFSTFYLHGLERRILVDAVQGKVPATELDALADELKRIEKLYPTAARMGSLSGLVEFIFVLRTQPNRQYEQTPIESSANYFEVPLSIRVAFGQAAVDRKPVPPEWALAWARFDPAVSKRTPAIRCSDEFRQLFLQRYTERFREGIAFSANKTKLKVPTRTSFPALRDIEYPEYISTLPDIAAITGPRNKLQELVNECTDALDAYSRFLGRNPEAKGALESVLMLPIQLWPQNTCSELNALVSSVGAETVVMTFGKLFECFKASGNVAREKLAALTDVLSGFGVAMEPDVRMTGRTPKPADHVALYSAPPNSAVVQADDGYHTAALMVDLAAAVAVADGNASSHEVALIQRQIESWSQLSPQWQIRLKARAAVQMRQPPTLTSLKKRLEPLPAEAKSAVATLLVRTANADGVVSTAEVKMLEKVYRLLGIDPQRLYSDLHGNVASQSPTGLRPVENREMTAGAVAVTPSQFALDSSRIEALQKETAQVSALLSAVFAEDTPVVESVRQQEPSEEKPASANLLGLDDAHSAFMRHLLSRPSWSRAELADTASDLDLMLDGAIEQVNEASLDAWDEPLTDGDDPVEINQELVQRLAA